MTNQRVTQNWAEFSPRDYLQEYYSNIGPENLALLKFTAKAFENIPSNGVLLDFGGGPTIYPLIAAADNVAEIHFSDYLEENLKEVHLWLQGEPSAFDWREFIKTDLQLKGYSYPTTQAISQREGLIRQKVTKTFRCDANNFPPISVPRLYDVLVTYFCAESATDDWAQWRRYLRNIVSLLKPNGFLLLSALKGASCYAVGEQFFPSVSLQEEDLTQALLEEGFDLSSIVAETIPSDHPSHEYEGLIVILAQKQGYE